MEKTLYISDLDGTLLNRQDRLSPFTVEALNGLLARGMLFTFATARSWHSAHVVTQGLAPSIPWIVHNGAILAEGATGQRSQAVYFTHPQREAILRLCREHNIWPLCYGILGGEEKVFYLDAPLYLPRHAGMNYYIDNRSNDKRLTPVTVPEELLQGETYYFTMIDDKKALAPLWEQVKDFDWLNLTFQQELYRQEYWLEITSQQATKAQAALRLKRELGCDRLVAFGDAMNDLPLFQAADECYAPMNAMPEVKAAATGIIDSNEEDGVAKVLLERLSKEEAG